MPAARLTTRVPGAHVRRDLGEQAGHVLRLDHQDQGVGDLGRLGVADDAHAVALAQLARPARGAAR